VGRYDILEASGEDGDSRGHGADVGGAVINVQDVEFGTLVPYVRVVLSLVSRL
jgi:hypothetical protein